MKPLPCANTGAERPARTRPTATIRFFFTAVFSFSQKAAATCRGAGIIHVKNLLNRPALLQRPGTHAGRRLDRACVTGPARYAVATTDTSQGRHDEAPFEHPFQGHVATPG